MFFLIPYETVSEPEYNETPYSNALGFYSIPIIEYKPAYEDLKMTMSDGILNITWGNNTDYAAISMGFYYLGNNQTYTPSEAASFGATFDYWINYNTGTSLKFGGIVNASKVIQTIKDKGYYVYFELVESTIQPKIKGGSLWFGDHIHLDWKDQDNPNNTFQIYNRTLVYLTNNGFAFHDTIIYDPIMTVENVTINSKFYNTKADDTCVYLEPDDTAGSIYENLTSYWSFDCDPINTELNTSFDWSSGDNDGSMMGDAVVNASDCLGLGNCLHLDGNGDYVEVPHSDAHNANDNLTITGWFYSPSISTAQMIMSKRTVTTKGWYIYLTTSKMRWLVYDSGGDPSDYIDSEALQSNRWYHFAVTWDDAANTANIYIDGVLNASDDTKTGTSVDDTDAMDIGRYAASGALSFKGLLDELMFFNTSLTAAQIKAIYYNSSPRFKVEGHHNISPGNITSGSTSWNRLNVTTHFSANFSSNVALAIEYYDGSWTRSPMVNLTMGSGGQNSTIFTITASTTNVTLNYTYYAGNATITPFYTPILRDNITLEAYIAALDTTPPDITHVSPTPSPNGTTVTTNSIYVNVTTNEVIDTCILEWDPPGTPSSATFSTHDVEAVSVAALDRQTFVVAWCDETDDDVTFAIYDTSGSEKVSATDIDAVGGCSTYNSISVSTFNSTDFVVAWYDLTDETHYAKVYNETGNNLTGNIVVDATSGQYAWSVSVSTFNSTDFVVGWINVAELSDDKTFRIFDHTGTAITNEIDVDSSANRMGLSVSTLNSTSFVYAWEDGYDDDISFAIYNYSGNIIKSVVDVDTEAGTASDSVSVSPFNSTDFVIAWYDDATSDVSFRIYDHTGTAITNIVDADSNAGDPSKIDVTVLNSTHYVIGWLDDGQNDATFRIYKWPSTAVTGVTDVDTGASDGSEPAIFSQSSKIDAGICDDNFIFVWADSATLGNWTAYSPNGFEWDGICSKQLATNYTMTKFSNGLGAYKNMTWLIDSVTYSWYIYCNDTSGNLNRSTGYQVTYNSSYTPPDEIPPDITFIFPTPDNDTNLTQDNYYVNVSISEAASSVLLELSNASGIYNYTMTNEAGNWYNFNATGQSNNNTFFYVYADDSSGNLNRSLARHVNISVAAPPADTCSPSAAQNWAVTISDNCTMQDSELTVKNVSVTGNDGFLAFINYNLTCSGWYWNATNSSFLFNTSRRLLNETV